MLTHLFPFLDPSHVTPDLSRRLRALADDCDHLERGRPVPPVVLQKAPLITDCVPALTPQGVQLIGRVTRHPLLGDCPAATPPLQPPDPNARWPRPLRRS